MDCVETRSRHQIRWKFIEWNWTEYMWRNTGRTAINRRFRIHCNRLYDINRTKTGAIPSTEHQKISPQKGRILIAHLSGATNPLRPLTSIFVPFRQLSWSTKLVIIIAQRRRCVRRTVTRYLRLSVCLSVYVCVWPLHCVTPRPVASCSTFTSTECPSILAPIRFFMPRVIRSNDALSGSNDRRYEVAVRRARRPQSATLAFYVFVQLVQEQLVEPADEFLRHCWLSRDTCVS
jgi:hypothetical protein